MEIKKRKIAEELVIKTWHLDPLPAGVTAWPAVAGHLKGYGQSRRATISRGVHVHLITSGSGTFHSFAGKFNVHAGEMFACWPDVAHDFYENSEDPWEFYWTRLDGPGSVDLGKQWGFDADHPIHCPEAPQIVTQNFRSLFEYWGRDPRDPYEGLVFFNRLIASSRPQEPDNSDAPRTSADIVQEAKMIIDMLLETGINVNELSERLNLCRGSLWRFFVEETGLSIKEWIRHARIERSKDLLIRTQFKMSVIARMCGFNDEKYFLRIFRQNVGMTPGKWRKAKSEINSVADSGEYE